MTGFGRGYAATEIWRATVEISSVNRKQAEIVVQAPRELAEIEGRIRKAVQNVISRGRVQVSVNLEKTQGANASIRVDASLARSFYDAFVKLGKSIGNPVQPLAADYLRQPGIFSYSSSPEINGEEAWEAIQPALESALSALATMRETEGNHLKADFYERLGILASFAHSIATVAPERPIRQKELLIKRLRESGLEIDPADERIVKELALFADRCDVSEELTRLHSHFAKFYEYLDASEPPGRALDFLCQELFREFNTIGSKANDANIAQTIVQAKTELEKIREQVQNVE